jgi:protease-3
MYDSKMKRIIPMSKMKRPAKKSIPIAKNKIIKSPYDDLNYDYFELENKMKVVVINDPKAKKSAASMNVSVGYLKDPKDCFGLAHFLEHMLFMGKSSSVSVQFA